MKYEVVNNQGKCVAQFLCNFDAWAWVDTLNAKAKDAGILNRYSVRGI